MKRITLRLPDNVLAALEKRALIEHRPVANLALRLLIQGLGITPDAESSKLPKTRKLEGLA